MPPAREGNGILPGLRSWSCTTPTNIGFHQTDEILQVVTVGTGGLPAFSRIMSVGEPGSMHPTTALVLSCRGLALGHTIGKNIAQAPYPGPIVLPDSVSHPVTHLGSEVAL